MAPRPAAASKRAISWKPCFGRLNQRLKHGANPECQSCPKVF